MTDKLYTETEVREKAQKLAVKTIFSLKDEHKKNIEFEKRTMAHEVIHEFTKTLAALRAEIPQKAYSVLANKIEELVEKYVVERKNETD